MSRSSRRIVTALIGLALGAGLAPTAAVAAGPDGDIRRVPRGGVAVVLEWMW
jgi:hypothetical protein